MFDFARRQAAALLVLSTLATLGGCALPSDHDAPGDGESEGDDAYAAENANARKWIGMARVPRLQSTPDGPLVCPMRFFYDPTAQQPPATATSINTKYVQVFAAGGAQRAALRRCNGDPEGDLVGIQCAGPILGYVATTKAAAAAICGTGKTRAVERWQFFPVPLGCPLGTDLVARELGGVSFGPTLGFACAP
jgi:hypothetical protein